MNRRIVRAAVAGAAAVALAITGLVAVGPAGADTAPRRIVNGWLPYYSMAASLNSATTNADLWSVASPFWYQATGATTIAKHANAAGVTDTTVIDALRAKGIKVVPTVTETLNAAAMAALLGDSTQRAAHVTTLVNLVTANAYDGIDLDYETMNSGTATDKATVRSGFVTLLRELGTALHANGKLLSIAVGPRTSATDPSWAVFDYPGLAPSVDRFRIMTYDYHWRGGSPGAVAPLAWVNTVLTYAVTAVTRSKIEIGMPLYGYDWPADATQTDGYGTASSVTYQQAEALRTQYAAVRQWSSTDAAPYFTYTTSTGVKHVVWYNDVDSAKAKMTLIPKYGVQGLTFWAVGSEDTRQWPALRSYAIQRTTKISISAPAAVTYGTAATVTGKVTTATGAAAAGQKVVLQWRPTSTAAWSTKATGTASSTGAVSLKYTPSQNGYFRLYAYASWAYLASASASPATQVRWRVTGAFADATVTRGTTIRLNGKVAPVRSGTKVQRQRYVNGVWTTVASTTIRTDGTFTFTFVWTTKGTFTYRLIVPGTTLNATGTSSSLNVYVS